MATPKKRRLNRKVIWRYLILAGILLLALFKCSNVLLAQSLSYFEVFAWAVYGIWMFWLAYAFFFNKDLPMTGSFRYRTGENQAARTLATVSMLSMYVFIVFF
jgi:fatty acid desaturase